MKSTICLTLICHFSRGAAKQKSGIERLSNACTQFQYDVGVLHDNKIWLTCFDYPYNMAINFDADRQIKVYATPVSHFIRWIHLQRLAVWFTCFRHLQ